MKEPPTCRIPELKTSSYLGPLVGRGIGAYAEVFREDTKEVIGVVLFSPKVSFFMREVHGWWIVFNQVLSPRHKENTLNSQLLEQAAENLRGIMPCG